jgi:DNA-binding response OmpR family regulator
MHADTGDEGSSGRAQALTRVLIVGPGPNLTGPLATRMRRHGFDVQECFGPDEAVRRHPEFDLLLLDLPLPEVDLLDLCLRLRTRSDLPVISLIDADTVFDQTLHLQAWSDHCLIKPYGFRELLARIEAVQRRYTGRSPASPSGGGLLDDASPARPMRHGQLRITPDTREVTVSGRAVNLTRKEFDLLHRLASEPNAVLSRTQLLAEVWGFRQQTGPFGPRATRTVDTHVSALRGKLGHRNWIVTVRGVGFRIGDPEADPGLTR